jgi:hypothetical protein
MAGLGYYSEHVIKTAQYIAFELDGVFQAP